MNPGKIPGVCTTFMPEHTLSSQVFNSGQAAPHRAPPSASRPSLVGKSQRLLKKETTRFLLLSNLQQISLVTEVTGLP